MCSLCRLWVDSANDPRQAVCIARQRGRGMSLRYRFTRQPTPILRHYPLEGFPCTIIDNSNGNVENSCNLGVCVLSEGQYFRVKS